MTEEKTADIDLDAQKTEEKISDFAKKLGEETSGNYSCYLYRIVKDEESGRTKKPFLFKYIGTEPDLQEIAEKYRGGSYLLQFSWKSGKGHKGKAFSIDIDVEAWPVKPSGHSMIGFSSGLSEPAQLQLAVIQGISEVMKSAYNNGPAAAPAVPSNPLEMFSGLMDAFETNFSRAMAIQSSVMERVYTRMLENRYGLDGQESGPAPGPIEEGGVLSKYGGLIREVVEGIKTVIGLFGEIPENVIQKVKKDNRFQEVIKDKSALVVIGQALRREFGDKRAAEIMQSFGVKMLIRPVAGPGETIRTPDIPPKAARQVPKDSKGATLPPDGPGAGSRAGSISHKAN